MSVLKGAKLRLPNIILFGAPGVGKGTYGTMLERDLNFKRVSTGDQIRGFLKKPNLSKEMQEIKLICQTGGLVSDQIILDIIVDSLKDFDSHKGVIFDGFPRNLKQLELFAERFDLDVSYVVNCLLNEDILVEKLAGRRVCEGCGHNYNICSIERDGYSMKPLMPKHGDNCDCCGGKLVQRDDDKEQTIRQRLTIYRQETEPLLQMFNRMGIKTMNFEPKRGVDDYPLLFNDLNVDYLDSLNLAAQLKLAGN